MSETGALYATPRRAPLNVDAMRAAREAADILDNMLTLQRADKQPRVPIESDEDSFKVSRATAVRKTLTTTMSTAWRQYAGPLVVASMNAEEVRRDRL
jgi:hypothetical protein